MKKPLHARFARTANLLSGNQRPRRRRSLTPASQPSHLELLEGRTLLSVFTVFTAADDGTGSLRQAILDANNSNDPNGPTADTIQFNIGAGPVTISLFSPLPALTDPVTIDATTEPGYSSNAPLITLDGSMVPTGDGLTLLCGGSTIQGLAISGFMSGNAITVTNAPGNTIIRNNYLGDLTGSFAYYNNTGIYVTNSLVTITGNVIAGNSADGIYLTGSNHSVISGNFIGTDATGAFPAPNAGNGITIEGNSSNNTIGGSLGADHNIISSNFGDGIRLNTTPGSSGNAIIGNHIGRTNSFGDPYLGNSGNGITIMGGGVAISGNVISGNFGAGIELGLNKAGTDPVTGVSTTITVTGDSNTITDNLIGTLPDGVTPLGNSQDGIFVDGSNNTIARNTIANNQAGSIGSLFHGNGVTINTGVANAITANSIYANEGIGIDLGNDGATANDSRGHDGPNLYQNFPVITAAQQNSTLTITGTLSTGLPNATFTIEFFANRSAASDQGETFLGSVTATTDASGIAHFQATFTDVAAFGSHITATATDPAGNTSEFSASTTVVTISAAPSQLSGHVFLDANNDGVRQASESGIVGVAVTLSGSNDQGAISPITVFTDSAGLYQFQNLRPGVYTIAEQNHAIAPLSAYAPGKDALGSVGGQIAGPGIFSAVAIGSSADAIDYDFGELQNVISGHTLRDKTGNGLTADDTPLAGITLSLYRESGNNSTLDSADGAPVATTLSNATGDYSFVNLPPGNYYVRETVPSGYIRTIPYFADFYSAPVSGDTNTSSLDFDNYRKCTVTVSSVSYTVTSTTGATKTVTDLRGNTKQDDTVTANFTLSGTFPARITLVSYDAPAATFQADNASQQTIYQISTQIYTAPGRYTLTVTNPSNYYQVDFVKCAAIDRFGPAASNIFYSAQGRLISADNAGTHSDVDNMAAATKFWANLGQSLIHSFNVSDANPNPTLLANWLVQNFPNLYGASGAYSLVNKHNADVASLFKLFFTDQSHHKTDASVLATALNVYASTNSLGGDAASDYGFVPTNEGLGAATFNVGANGSAFGVANNSTRTVMQLLQSANSKSKNDVLYNGVSSLLTLAYNMFETVNNAGDIIV